MNDSTEAPASAPRPAPGATTDSSPVSASGHDPAPNQITTEQVEHVARLARLEITAEQTEMFAQQLSQVLEHGREMSALDLDAVAPTSHPLPLSNVLREDEVGEVVDREEVLSQAPESANDRFSVPPVLEAP